MVHLREAHARDKAALLSAPSDHSPVRPLEGNRRLVEQLDTLRAEQRKAQQAFSDERRAQQVDFAAQLQATERKYKTELLEAKSAMAMLEDKLLQVQEDLSTAVAGIAQQKARSEQIDLLRQRAVDEQARLKADLKNMQQSAQVSPFLPWELYCAIVSFPFVRVKRLRESVKTVPLLNPLHLPSHTLSMPSPLLA